MKSLKRINLKNKKVVLRLDLDVPIDENGKITDDTRLRESLPTLNYLKKAKQIIIIGHLGRPKKIEDKFKLDKVAKKLSSLLKIKIKKLDDFVNINIPKNKFIMLENLRFSDKEKLNDKEFSKQLASFGDIYVNDAFAVSHRKCSSIVGITKFIPPYPGLKLESEIKNITKILKKQKKPLILLIGGIKIDKLIILKSLIKKADAVLIGGKMMFTFLEALNYDVGKLKFSNEEIKLAKQIMNKKIILPIDTILENNKNVYIEKIPNSKNGYDIGIETIEIFSEILRNAGTIIWNGSVGFCEKGFNKGTLNLAKTIVNSKATSLVGGGDTTFSIKKFRNKFTHCSTAGGAFLQLVSGKKLPGIEALK